MLSENLNIQSKNILIDKNTKLTIFKNDVLVKDGNEYRTDYAEYDKNLNLLNSKGKTTIITSQGFVISGEHSFR